MRALPLPPLEYLRECFSLSEGSPSGLVWKARPRGHFATSRAWLRVNSMYEGKPAGRINSKPGRKVRHWRVNISNGAYFVHRIIWALFYGNAEIPEDIDHVDGNGLNNQICNLRLATHGQNQANRLMKPNQCGFKGVYPSTGGRFRARIRYGSKICHLGTFSHPGEAHAAFSEAAKNLHGQFAKTS